jgi:hypothetical protein
MMKAHKIYVPFGWLFGVDEAIWSCYFEAAEGDRVGVEPPDVSTAELGSSVSPEPVTFDWRRPATWWGDFGRNWLKRKE